jgi:K+-sensing histidine kinase KdpD
LRIEAAIGSELRNVAHDLSGPLTALKVGISRLPKNLETLTLISESVRRIDDISATVLKKPKHSAHETGTITGYIDGLKHLRTQYTQIHPQLKIDICYEDLEHSVPNSVSLSDIAFVRIAENIIGNSVRELDGRGRILVLLKRSRKVIVFTVSDTGAGYPDVMLKWFGTGVESENFTHNFRGTGLGLRFVAYTLAGVGGTIRLRNAEATGAITIVEIPLT